MRPVFSSVLLSLAMSIDEVRHLWLRLKAVNILLDRAVGHNHTLVLAQVFCPGFHDEGFHVVRWALRIAINTPAERAGARATISEERREIPLLDSLQRSIPL